MHCLKSRSMLTILFPTLIVACCGGCGHGSKPQPYFPASTPSQHYDGSAATECTRDSTSAVGLSHVIETLGKAYTEGALTADEFERAKACLIRRYQDGESLSLGEGEELYTDLASLRAIYVNKALTASEWAIAKQAVLERYLGRKSVAESKAKS